MEPQQVVSKFLQLPAEAQQIVADLIAHLDRREAPSRQLASTALAAAGAGAIILPPLVGSNMPDSSSKNPFADPDSQSGEADWNRPDFDFREWRRQIWERPKVQL